MTAHHIAAVDAARSALRAHAPARALQLVARDRARCPRGALGEERERIAVEALVARGLRGEAARGLAAFERAYPASLHRRALRALVDGLASPALPSAP